MSERFGWYVLDNDHNPHPAKNHADAERAFDGDRRVARDEVLLDDGRTVTVSTVFLALDHRHTIEGPPILFETMVFGGNKEIQQRYTTWDEAVAGHQKIVADLIDKKVKV